MGLTLKIENHTSLPDGGPLSVSIKGKRGIDIGRDQYLDWTLPDPSRFISGRHCEVRWHDGAYWLHDISTNGTFLDGADSRLKGPHRLRNGDRFAIGHYIIVAAIDDEGAGDRLDANAPRSNAPPSYEDLWKPVGEVAPPIDPKELKAPRDLQPVHPDFLDWAIDVPAPYTPSPSPPPSAPQRAAREPAPWNASPAPAAGDMSWAQGPPKPPPPAPEVPPVPSPRRPVWVSNEPQGPWAAPRTAAQPASAEAPASVPAAPPPLLPALAGQGWGGGAGDGREGAASGHPAALSGMDGAAMTDFVRLFARGAGLPEDALTGRDPAQFAEQLGQLMRLVAENVRQLLEARQMAKRLSRSSNQTMVQAVDNNPLKFAPSAEDALRIMFGPPTRSYLDAWRAFSQSFDDLKSHQLRTFSAMQHALRLMLGEFDPDVIDNTAAADRGLAGMVGSRKARLWDIYVARWQARTQGRVDGMLNAFMDYFADCYDRDER
ncbi:MAG TPA: type VI secretion system-associated FHA domain protein TagH [Xanthobacteraceae bacterium]|jgi:type VI secretion system protein ImpI|nr:type VI secretion system-associated FHA domain protein TagH [Xanthobacteraceae bacterium]